MNIFNHHRGNRFGIVFLKGLVFFSSTIVFGLHHLLTELSVGRWWLSFYLLHCAPHLLSNSVCLSRYCTVCRQQLPATAKKNAMTAAKVNQIGKAAAERMNHDLRFTLQLCKAEELWAILL